MMIPTKMSNLKIGSQFIFNYTNSIDDFGVYEKITPVKDSITNNLLFNAINLNTKEYIAVSDDEAVIKVNDSRYCKSCANYTEGCDRCKSFENWRFGL